MRFSRLFSNLDNVIGLEGGHSARHRLYSGKPHLQAWQRRAYARLLCGGECLSAQVSAMQCQPTQSCTHLRHTACIHSTASSRTHTWASGLEAATFRAICQQVPGNQSCLLKTDYVEVVTGCDCFLSLTSKINRKQLKTLLCLFASSNIKCLRFVWNKSCYCWHSPENFQPLGIQSKEFLAPTNQHCHHLSTKWILQASVMMQR